MFKLPSSEVPGYSAIYRNDQFKDGTLGSEFSHITTAYELLQHQLANAPKTDFLGTRKFNAADGSFGAFEWMTTTDAAQFVNDMGSGLDHVFAQYAPDAKGHGTQQPLGMYGNNRYEWFLTEFSAHRSRRYVVGICDSVDVESAEFIINHSDVQVIVCSIDKIPRMFDRLSVTPHVRVVICMDRLDCSRPNPLTLAFNKESAGKLRERAAELGITLFDIDEVLEMGRKSPTVARVPGPSDICVMCYTSGTTGTQKGVLLTHRGLIEASRSSHLSLRFSDSVHLSFIPLAHCLDRYVMYMFMHGGVRIGFSCGDRALLLNDLQELKPTVLIGFPLLLNSIYENMARATIKAKGPVGVLSRMAYRGKQKRLSATGDLCHGLWDRMVFRKVAALLGGRVKAVISGALDLKPEVINFFRAAFSCDVVQGYGQTETGGAGTIQRLSDYTSGHIGVPNGGSNIRLRNQPGYGYLATDVPCPRGELMIRSNTQFAGYYKEPEKTKATMDGEWLATGDIVQINPTGTVSFISRIKHHVKLNTGYCVSAERLENVYGGHPLVQSMFVDGHPDFGKVVAIIVPDPIEFVPWARVIAGLPEASLETLCGDDGVVEELRRTLLGYSASMGLSVGEQLGAVFIEPVPFREKNCGLFTSLLKFKRQAATKYYAEVLDKLYKEVDNRYKTDSL
ncbi:medium-chain fatty acid-CoA ligase faa2 [Coemansia sp. S85]|nr:medium-chain fatty acid-CoA ligase faa2 [Coemansia sp. S85]